MHVRHWIIAASLALLLSVAARSPAEELTPQSFDRLLKLIKPTADEASWAAIPWMINMGEARKKAAAEGKPLVVWTMSGEPLGMC
jgi:hypothetical protein